VLLLVHLLLGLLVLDHGLVLHGRWRLLLVVKSRGIHLIGFLLIWHRNILITLVFRTSRPSAGRPIPGLTAIEASPPTAREATAARAAPVHHASRTVLTLRCTPARHERLSHSVLASVVVVVLILRFLPVLSIVMSPTVVERGRAATAASVRLLLLAHSVAISSVIGATATATSIHGTWWTTLAHHIVGGAATELAKVA